MASSLDSGSRSQLTARYHARSTHGPARPGHAQSTRIVRPSACVPRLPYFQSPCTRVAGVGASAVISGIGSVASDSAASWATGAAAASAAQPPANARGTASVPSSSLSRSPVAGDSAR